MPLRYSRAFEEVEEDMLVEVSQDNRSSARRTDEAAKWLDLATRGDQRRLITDLNYTALSRHS